MLKAHVDPHGRITVPREVRERLGLQPGDRLEFIEQDGMVHVRRQGEEASSGDHADDARKC